MTFQRGRDRTLLQSLHGMLRNGKEVDGIPYEEAIQSIIDAEGNLSELRWRET